MNTIYFTYFNIDLADIWEYETDCYNHQEKSFAYYDELYSHLQPYYLAANHKPFLSQETIKSGTHKQHYYDYWYKQLQKRDQKLFHIFELDGCFYEMKTPCTINRENTSKLNYQKFFSLKLSQYKHGLIYLKEFLSYHLTKTFNDDQKEYYDFLNLTLIQKSEILGKIVSDQVNRIISSSDLLPKLTKSENLPYYRESIEGMKAWMEKPDDIEEGTDEFSEKENESLEKEIPVISDFGQKPPLGYHFVEGALTNGEVFDCFTFLYLEKSESGNPFLPENVVREIFKYGIAIPPKTVSITRYKLNCSTRFPKKIMECAIYRFYKLYDHSYKLKLDIIRFFASYIDDFHFALESKEKLEMLGSNIVRRKRGRMKFKIEKYIPERPINIKHRHATLDK